jgi:hypothetical protein
MTERVSMSVLDLGADIANMKVFRPRYLAVLLSETPRKLSFGGVTDETSTRALHLGGESTRRRS